MGAESVEESRVDSYYSVNADGGVRGPRGRRRKNRKRVKEESRSSVEKLGFLNCVETEGLYIVRN